MSWVTVEKRLGQFGKNKESLFQNYDSKYGKDNWRIAWQFGDKDLDFLQACKAYEESYFQNSYNNEMLWNELRNTASQVYDIDSTDIDSGLDYLIQNNHSTHIQDIAIRNVFKRREWEFNGKELVQIRSNSEYECGRRLSPMRVKFYKPELITQPQLQGWWNKKGIEGSVEEWYQSNKILQVKAQNLTYVKDSQVLIQPIDILSNDELKLITIGVIESPRNDIIKKMQELGYRCNNITIQEKECSVFHNLEFVLWNAKSKNSNAIYLAKAKLKDKVYLLQQLNPNSNTSIHKHEERLELFHNLVGECWLKLEKETKHIKQSTLQVEQEKYHQLLTKEKPALNLLEIQSSTQKGLSMEDHIYKKNWNTN
ncbi:MAG: hypothetical protein WC393_02800 [Candidatus Nanoarchaeia archaeon]|jgi:hypothetical protein